MGRRPAPPPYVSPFDRYREVSSPVAAMLRRVESALRDRLEAEEVSAKVAIWIAGGGTREGRARRADVAIYARQRLRSLGWPKLWRVHHFAAHDAQVCADRRARGLLRQTVEQTCASCADPTSPPAPKRQSAAEVRQLELDELFNRLREIVRPSVLAPRRQRRRAG